MRVTCLWTANAVPIPEIGHRTLCAVLSLSAERERMAEEGMRYRDERQIRTQHKLQLTSQVVLPANSQKGSWQREGVS